MPGDKNDEKPSNPIYMAFPSGRSLPAKTSVSELSAKLDNTTAPVDQKTHYQSIPKSLLQNEVSQGSSDSNLNKVPTTTHYQSIPTSVLKYHQPSQTESKSVVTQELKNQNLSANENNRPRSPSSPLPLSLHEKNSGKKPHFFQKIKDVFIKPAVDLPKTPEPTAENEGGKEFG